MGLATHAAAIALGYLLGSPAGRARLAALGGKGRELAARPEAKRARERAWDVAGEAGLAAKNRLTARTRRENAGAAPESGTSGSVSSVTDPPDDGAQTPDAPERLPATTVAEDTHAVVTGLPTPDVDRPEPPPTRD